MDAEIAALASSGATTLVGLMVTDAWTQARGRFAALFRSHQADVQAELDASRDEVVRAADPETAQEAAVEWRARLRRALAADPQAVAELRELVEEFAPSAELPAGSVVNVISGGRIHGQVIQGHTFGDITLNVPDAER